MSNEKSVATGFEGLTWQVHKFGGTSVASAECFLTVAGILEEQLQPSDVQNVHLACVVSAMGGKPKVTDLLLESVEAASRRDEDIVNERLTYILDKHTNCLSKLFGGSSGDQQERERLLSIIEKDIEDIRDILKTVSLMKWQAHRISELVSGYGELWSAQILCALMQKRSEARQQESSNSPREHKFVYLDARRVITVDEEAIQNGAIVWDISQTKLHEVYAETAQEIDDDDTILHFIVTGYVATNTHNVATTLQRDGSDYSAAIMGRLLSAQSIVIWTDVDGVLTADPRRVPLSQVMSEVSYNEAMELAYFGAKVIHPKTMQPAILAEPQIPIYIRNTFNSSFRGTRIFTSSTTHTDREKVICGFTSIENMALINVEGSGMIGIQGVAKRMFGTLESLGINVVLISQASSEHSVTFATTEEQAVAAKEAIEEEFSRELRTNRISSVDIRSPCSIIAAVGDGMHAVSGVCGRFFSALGEAKINVLAIAQGSSERNISAVVQMEQSTRALRAVHAAFRLSHSTVRIGIFGMNELGDSLLRLLVEQRDSLRQTFDIDLQVCVVLAGSESSQIVRLKNDRNGCSDSITMNAFNRATDSNSRSSSPSLKTSFQDEDDLAVAVPGDVSSVLKYLFRDECSNHVIFDCTNDEEVSKHHADWLRSSVHIVTANNTGLSGPKELRDDIHAATRYFGSKQSARYLREVTVGGGLPIISTLRTLLHSGDRIARIDGILSVSLSFIMFRISPPPDISKCSEFDKHICNGAYDGGLTPCPSCSSSNEAHVGTACSFSHAVKEAIALGLMEEDPTKDLNNEYTSRVLMVLARELGMDHDLEVSDIQDSSDKLLEMIVGGSIDYHSFPPEIDQLVKERVEAAKARGCVLRQISSIDVKDKRTEVKIIEVPTHHIFAVTPPSCECFRFFTRRHRAYPLIIQGPSAGVDSTASALLAELLQLMRGKASPRSVALSRTDSGTLLRSRSKANSMTKLSMTSIPEIE